MLRVWFIKGALIVLGTWLIAMTVMELGRWLGLDLAIYASTALIVVVLVWAAAMLGGGAYRVIRFFAKPS